MFLYVTHPKFLIEFLFTFEVRSRSCAIRFISSKLCIGISSCNFSVQRSVRQGSSSVPGDCPVGSDLEMSEVFPWLPLRYPLTRCSVLLKSCSITSITQEMAVNDSLCQQWHHSTTAILHTRWLHFQRQWRNYLDFPSPLLWGIVHLPYSSTICLFKHKFLVLVRCLQRT